MDRSERKPIWESEAVGQDEGYPHHKSQAQVRGTETLTWHEADQMVKDALRDMREEGITDGAALLIKAWAERDNIADVMDELMKARPRAGAMAQLLRYVQDSLYG